MPETWSPTPAGKHLSGRRKTNTGPELLLRKALHAAGARFRLHRRIAKGCTPDIVMPSRSIAVFVDGCYWHSCPVHGRKAPFTGPNAQLWEQKMRRNRERDARSSMLAAEAGWTVVRVWECSIRADAASAATSALVGESTPPRENVRLIPRADRTLAADGNGEPRSPDSGRFTRPLS